MLRQVTFVTRRLTQPRSTQLSRSCATNSQPSRIARIESRLPRFLQRIFTPIRNAPVSHVTAFLILHELTAVVPLFGLAAIFHFSNWLPPYISEGKWVHGYTAKFGRWLAKKGWISDDERSGRYFATSESGLRIAVELATAYAITKALLPLRLAVSVWATPWFARWTVLPLTNLIRRLSSGSKVKKPTVAPAAGTGAVGAGVLPKDVDKHLR